MCGTYSRHLLLIAVHGRGVSRYNYLVPFWTRHLLLIAVHGRGVSRYNYLVPFWTDWEEN